VVGQGFQGVLLGSRVFFLSPGCSSWLLGVLGAKVDDSREGSWSRCYEVLALLGR
jgi:hypothetical protein